MRKECKVYTDRGICYILSDRIDNMKHGEYVLDSLHNIYVNYQGYLLPIAEGSHPEGEYKRIEASNNYKILVPRISEGFRKAAKKFNIKSVNVRYHSNGLSLSMDKLTNNLKVYRVCSNLS